MYIVTTQQMQAAEQAADAAGLTYEQLMEHAGHAVAQAIAVHYDLGGGRVLVLVGPGNNGGDGLVVARYLAQMGALVTVYVWKRQTDADENWQFLDATGVEKVLGSANDSQGQLAHLLDEADLIVDALLGTGVSRPIEGTLADLLEQVKSVVTERRGSQNGLLIEPALPLFDPEGGPFVIAVDLPSGLNSDTGAVDPYTLRADVTVTLAAVKRGHILMPGPEVVGQLVVGDIGLAPQHYPAGVDLEMVTAAKVAALLPARPVGANKGTFGTALLITGSVNYTGAAVLAGQSAARSGAGLITLASPQTIYPILAAHLAEATYLPLPDEAGTIAPAAVSLLQETLAKASAVLIGPGLGQAGRVADFLLALLAEKDALPPLVLDADALNILAGRTAWWELLPQDCILTPHPGEMGRLMAQPTAVVQADRLGVARQMAATWGQIVLLKGAHTLIAAPDGRLMVQPFANPALAKAGSGDVLAGLIVGLRAQGLLPFEAAVGGAYLHGLAGEIAAEQLGATAVIAGDLIRFLPEAIKEVRR